MTKITIVDYGVGNLLNVVRACAFLGADVVIAETPGEVERAERLILPGVGAFRTGMKGLQERGLVEPLRHVAGSGRPFLGICLGMQLMFDCSEEFGVTQGLGLIAGRVVALPAVDAEGRPVRVPHMGWSSLQADRPWRNSLLSAVPDRAEMYFVHSFQAIPTRPEDLLAHCLFGSHHVCAAIGRENLFGCQFHPEKSGPKGLGILDTFFKL